MLAGLSVQITAACDLICKATLFSARFGIWLKAASAAGMARIPQLLASAGRT